MHITSDDWEDMFEVMEEVEEVSGAMGVVQRRVVVCKSNMI